MPVLRVARRREVIDGEDLPRDPDERVSSQFLLVGVPATFLIDKQGVLRWKKTGPVAPGDTSLSNAIERALSASGD